jgi:hypothetical protein
MKNQSNPLRILALVVLRETISDIFAMIRNFRANRVEKFEFKQPRESVTNTLNRLGSPISQSHEDSKFVVLDQFPVPQWLAINSVIAQEIALTLGASPKIFVFRRPSKFSIRIHSVFGLSNFLIIRLNIDAWKMLYREYAKLLAYLDTNSKLIDYKIGDIPIGLDIYESILRLGRETVSLRDLQTYRVSYLALKQYCFFEPLFVSRRVAAVLVSHDNYVGPGLLAHMAFSFKTPVILANSLSLSMPTAPFQLYEKLARFREYAQEISSEELAVGISWAESELQARLEGQIGVGMDYQLKSAFTKHKLPEQTSKTKNLKVLILTHDFFDNPHGYGRMLFDDFYLWLEFLAEISTTTNYDWYIKPHRDYSNFELKVLKDFTNKFPKIKLISSETTYHQLKEEGVNIALTCFGSAGHELPLLGFTVINASYNPHIAYSFNIHAKTIDEYTRILTDLPNRLVGAIDPRDIFEFYYIQNRFVNQDSIMGISHAELVKLSEGNIFASGLITHLLENHEKIRDSTIFTLRQMVSHRLVYEFEKKISSDSQLKVEIGETNQQFYEKMRFLN